MIPGTSREETVHLVDQDVGEMRYEETDCVQLDQDTAS